ncbi:PIG-L deacetylase family protein [Agathobaculum sp. NTUH-O15-33]|uniref:PIG-L deacetylase family protein n=1 Tax=Agathobaculum sp. NTUH-O15-33 TaxID=3079302 RepID=UPI0029589FD8|nr:PIG-L deacetylase family protein [Agathobaculum sp. NTUH-O15-33]WNX84993.1 PIG-L deacetylase family protein [Agathobaculum sp. NTUH-O15-33]
MNVLAVVAHPDDADLWCGGTLKKYAEQGHTVSILVATNGRTGTHCKVDDQELIARREKEQLAAASLYPAAVQFLRLDDGELFNDRDTRRLMIDAMRRAQPDVILTHDPCDGNVDHHTVGAIVQDSIVYLPLENVRVQTPALQRQPTVFLMDTYAGVGPMPTAFVDITDQFETKRQALLCHRSQLTAETSWEEMLEVQGKFRGMQAGFRYAEAFKGFQLFDSMPDYKLLP